ncbi:inner membrane-spanning protein YciB [uncultured Cardiobacterium sp.]|uniref:inner membrane-spanning protein YciB n=1 Tax=uncultured Cardiobacterium sp. TaxID=417619 RepID=UPI002621A139|nr:inner membrane-spanning protein YciB [uncultured Cardiobacterium sp.]
MQEFFPALAFVLAYIVAAKASGYGSQAIYWATAAAMISTILQLAWMRLHHRKIEKRHWITALLILTFGTVTLVVKNPMIIKWKVSVAYLVFACGLLGAQWLGKINLVREMLGSVFDMPATLWNRLNLIWVLFFIVMAVLNLVVAYRFSEGFWVGFKLGGTMGAAILFIAAQIFFLRRYLKQEQQPHE